MPAAVALAAALAATAVANVIVYTNDFSTRGEAREAEGTGAKACDKRFLTDAEAIEILVKKGRACIYRLPVEGADDLPDHDLRMKAKLLTDTPGSIRDTAYVGVQVRAGGGELYELRVFPRTKDFALRRTPSGPDFPVNGNDDAIKRVGKNNKIRLEIFGTRVRAIVNGSKIADVNDSDPGDVKGQGLRLVVGNTGNTKKNTLARLDDAKVAVPNP